MGAIGFYFLCFFIVAAVLEWDAAYMAHIGFFDFISAACIALPISFVLATLQKSNS